MTFNTLLLTTDGSEPAEAAARRGFDLATQLGAAVHVLSVADSSLATGVGYSGESPRIRKRLREQATVRATSLQTEATERELDATAAVREGIPAREIVDYADEHDIDGIVIGTAGRGGVARTVVGSVADKVIRTASVPVLTVNQSALDTGKTFPLESILVPTDGSSPSEVAAGRGLDFAAQLDATVHLLSVVDADVADGLAALFDGRDAEPREQLVEQAGEHLATLTTEARARDVECVTATVEGTPAREIVDYADEHDVGTIVMGTHGRGGFERLVVGSVADAVVRTASVPVLTVRPNEVQNSEDRST